jgi:hypothetical protein
MSIAAKKLNPESNAAGGTMGDSETEYIMELQPRIAERLNELGFSGNGRDVLVHSLAELASRSRTLNEHALPLFLTLDASHRQGLAEVTVALKNHLDAMEDAITDSRPALNALVDFLLTEDRA